MEGRAAGSGRDYREASQAGDGEAWLGTGADWDPGIARYACAFAACLQGKFLIDGFPRSFDNMDGWDKVIGGRAFGQWCLDIFRTAADSQAALDSYEDL